MSEIELYKNSSLMNRRLDKKHFIRCFLEIKANRSENTAISYERDIKDFFSVERVEDISLEDIRKVNIFDAEKYILYLSNMGMSSATINRKIASLSSLYKWILKFKDNYTNTEVIKYNPFSALKEEKPVVNNKETEFLTKDECKILIKSINVDDVIGLRNRAMISLALTTALRKSEIINIKIKDISKYGEYNIIHIIRKGKKRDLVKVQPEVFSYINEYMKKTNRNFEEHKEKYLFLGHSKNSDENKPLDPSSFNYIIKKICFNAQINKKLKVHSTRHTAITIAITNGVTLEKVREFAGHKNIATTNRYIHSIDKLKDNAGDTIDIF